LLITEGAPLRVAVIGYVPTGLVGSAALAKVAVKTSPFFAPVIVPVNVGFGSPYGLLAFAADADRGAGFIVNVPVDVTE
jgi:hypothetical protein